jgi:hypothetical protein
MTTRQWQLVAGFAVAFCAVALIAGLLTKTRAERDAMTATHYLDSVSAQLDTARLHLADAEALARTGLLQANRYRVTIDSIWPWRMRAGIRCIARSARRWWWMSRTRSRLWRSWPH